MHSSISIIALGAALVVAQNNPDPAPVLLTTAKSGVLPTLPSTTGSGAQFTGVLTNEGAVIAPQPPYDGLTGLNGDASVQSNLPSATYTATLPSVAFDALTGSTPKGSIIASSGPGANGVNFVISFSDLPDIATYGPLMYHIHTLAVPTDGNCSATMGHLDPTNRGEYYSCNATAPQTCQAGDLAGKHGKITSNPFSANITDLYLSTDPASPYFFGGLSVVIHTSNATRITCANFAKVAGVAPSSGGVTNGTTGSGSSTSGSTTGSPVGPSTTASGSSTAFTGAAVKITAASAVVGVAAVVALLL